MANNDDITLLTILQHMQAMEQRLTARVDGVDVKVDRLETKVDRLETKVDRLETRVNGLETKLVRVEAKVDLALVQIGNIDERLDDVEVVQLPKVKKAVGIK